MTTNYKPHYSRYGFETPQCAEFADGKGPRWGWNGTTYQLMVNYTAASTALDLDMQGNSLRMMYGAGAPVAKYTFGSTALSATTIAASFSQVTVAADPTVALQVATKQYVDNVAQGLDAKPSVRVATVANITLSAPQTIDGVAVIAGDRVLVKAQSAPAENGIYVAAAAAWTRATDFDTWVDVPGAFVFVEQGTVTQNSGWTCTADAGGTLGVTAVAWAQFSAAGAYTASNGVTLSGSNFTLSGSPVITVGDLLIGAATAGNVTLLADTSTGNALISGGAGVAPSYGKIGLATHVSGTLGIANGGTGATTALAAFDALAPSTTAGDFTYMGASTSQRLAGNTTASRQMLSMVSSVPSWSALIASDIPDISATYVNVASTQTVTGAKTFSAAATFSAGFSSAATVKVGTGTAGAVGSPYVFSGAGTMPATPNQAYGFVAATVVDSTNTVGYGYASMAVVNGAASWHQHYVASNATVNSGTLTNQAGVSVPDLTTAVNNYGFYGLVSAGANKYNLYMVGTANNYINGEIWHTKDYVYATSPTVPTAREGSVALTTAALTATNLDTFVATTARSATYTIQAFDSVTGNAHMTTLNLIRDNSNNVFVSEFGTLYNSIPLATFAADYDGTSLIRVRVTPASVNSTQFKAVRTLMMA